MKNVKLYNFSSYIDDIFIASKSEEKHLDDIRSVFNRV